MCYLVLWCYKDPQDQWMSDPVVFEQYLGGVICNKASASPLIDTSYRF